MPASIEFVFSFRSPYAWIAAKHVLPQIHPDVAVRWTPFLPLPTFPNFRASAIPAKARHNVQDILRLTAAYGITVGRPPIDEPDWCPAHAAFLRAEENGRGAEFAHELMDERWSRGQVVSESGAIARVASAVGLDGDAIAADAMGEELQSELVALVQRNFDERHIFGVPMAICETGEYFWGHDRIEWALRHGFIPAV